MFRCFKCGKDLQEGERYVGFKRPYGLRFLCLPCYTATGGNPAKIRQRVRGGAETLMRERFRELQLRAQSRAKVETNPGLLMPIVMGLSAGTASALAAGAVAAAQKNPRSKKNPGQEKVRVEGMLKSRWRCPECLRAVQWTENRGTFYCRVHGAVEGVDITTTKRKGVKDSAIELGVEEYLRTRHGQTVSVSEIHRDTGLNLPYLKKLLKHMYYPDDKITYKKYLEDINNIKIVGG